MLRYPHVHFNDWVMKGTGHRVIRTANAEFWRAATTSPVVLLIMYVPPGSSMKVGALEKDEQDEDEEENEEEIPWLCTAALSSSARVLEHFPTVM